MPGKYLRAPSNVRSRARELRKPLTPAEQALWRRLRNRCLAMMFRRQHPIGRFIVDFYCGESRLAVEIDGGGHRELAQAIEDSARTEWLQSRGYRVLRLPNSSVMGDLEASLLAIRNAGSPSPAERERGKG